MQMRLVALVLVALAFAPGLAAERPNIVVIFMDDLGYSDLGIDGALDVRTPNLDRLAREGVRLTQCYAAAPVCTPTRAAFMTGRYQHRVGLESVISVSLGNTNQGLSPEEPTLPRYLHDAGYATALVGKWHLGSKPEFHPNRHGFDEFFGFLGGAIDYYSHLGEDGTHDLYENERPVHLDRYLTDEITDRAISFIERHRDKPFFIDVAYNATHWPFQPPGLTKAPHPSGTSAEVVKKWAAEGTRKDYVRMLERADEGIGRILAAIDRHGLRKNTLVIFTSDNGGEWLSRMDPLFHRKATLWEGGLRVPCMFRWPAQLPSRRISAQPAITMDLTATILAAGGASVRKDRPLDGIDLLPLLKGSAPAMERTFYWRGIRAGSQDRAVRDGRWKYITQSTLFPGLVFDVAADPGERKDLAARHPEILHRLEAKHREWESAVVPQRKRAIETGKPGYKFSEGPFGPEILIPAVFNAPENADVRIANCNGATAWGLQRKVNGQWVDAWVSAMDACMSAPIHVRAGGVHSYEHLIRPRAGAVLHPRRSADAVVEAGTYRIVWYGVELPLEQRVSNEFEIE